MSYGYMVSVNGQISAMWMVLTLNAPLHTQTHTFGRGRDRLGYKLAWSLTIGTLTNM